MFPQIKRFINDLNDFAVLSFIHLVRTVSRNYDVVRNVSPMVGSFLFRRTGSFEINARQCFQSGLKVDGHSGVKDPVLCG